MQLLKRIRWVYVLLSLFLIGVGVCLFLQPGLSSATVCCAVGLGAMLFGIVKIVLYFLRELNEMAEQYDFAIGAMSVIAGAVLLIHPTAVLALIPQVLGIYMLVDCVFKLQVAMDARRLGNKGWWVSLIVTLLCICWGCLLIWQPFGLENYRTPLIASGLVADGVQNLVSVAYIAGTVKKTEASGKAITEPAEDWIPVTIPPAPPEDKAPEPAPIQPEPESPAAPETPADAPAPEPEPAPAPAEAKESKKKFRWFEKKESVPAAEPPLTPPKFEPDPIPDPVSEDSAETTIETEEKGANET